MYRMTRNTPLATGQRYGDIIKDGDLKPHVIARLLESGTISRISTPPLTELPNWESRAEILVKGEVVTIQDLIDADSTALARKVKKPVRIIKQWQDEALAWLNPPKKDNSG